MRISDWSSDVCSSDLSRGGIISSCIIGAAALALVARVLVLQRGGIVVEHQALLASQRDEAAALGAADSVRPACFASATPQAVKPERDTRMGMPICTVLITISEEIGRAHV